MSESRLNVPSLRNLLHGTGFRGSVRALSALGPIENANILCAYLACSRQAPHEVFINTNIDCDHHHLTNDVMDLVRAFENGLLDHAWNRKPNGDASTGIISRGAAARAGLPASQWAPNPYRNSG